jgi:hypothetical protein
LAKLTPNNGEASMLQRLIEGAIIDQMKAATNKKA